MKPAAAFFTLALLYAGRPLREEVLENDFVRVTVDPYRGGAVTSIAYKKATSFPLIADKGAGVAGSGAYFLPVLDGAELSTPEAKATVRRDDGDAVLTITAQLKDGLTFGRTFRLGRDESGLRFTDTWSASRDRAVRPGSASHQKSEPWRLTARTWSGDASRAVLKNLPGGSNDAMESKAAPYFWRMIGPYGVGFLLQVRTAPAPAKVTLELPKGNGGAADWRWDATAEVSLQAGKALSVESALLIDEGGREGNAPSDGSKGDRVGVTLDVRAGARAGETVPVFATVVSAVRRNVVLSLAESYEPASSRVLHTVSLTLEPGKAKILPFDVTPAKKGACSIGAGLAEDGGKVLASTAATVTVDGEDAAWTNFQKKIPTSLFKGTWAEIGAQLAKAGRMKPRPADARAAERKAFYEKHFPHYAELIKGAAEALKVTPEQLAAGPPSHGGRSCFVGPADQPSDEQIRLHAEADSTKAEACMDIFFNGPDGPINAFSKERSGTGMGGLAYMKVIPDKGYAYHVYECGSWQNGYGVNSEGLATSGASINCDGKTTSAGRLSTQEWKAAGKMVAPLGSHMLLATCKNVDEAVAFIENPLAPFEFEGNKLFVDRAGNAARLESVGIRRQIHRFDPKRDRFFVAGNYPHEGRDGSFCVGPDWGWAANTMLRERLLEELAGSKVGRISLKDAFSLMETHAAGGMCQHLFDNVGRLHTSNSFLAVSRTSDLWLSQGPPCRVRYYRFTLAE